MIERKIKKELLSSIKYFPATVILGARQVGKTTLAKEILQEFGKKTIYFDLEIQSDYEKLSQDSYLFLKEFEQKTIIIDEVQRIPELFPTIRALIDQKQKAGRFILLGSAGKEILQSSSESLAGRVNYIEMQPILLSELKPKDLKNHFVKGGFPKAYLSKTPELLEKWFNGFVSSYIERDLQMLGLKANPLLIRRLITMLASMNGNLLNYSTLANSLGVSSNTVKSYIDFLEHAYIIRRIMPFHSNIGKRLSKQSKVYFRDSGLLHYFLRIFDYNSLINSHHLGASWEGYVIQQIIPKLDFRITPYFYRTQNGAELDLILVEGNNIKKTIEIKFSSNPKLNKGNYSALNDLGNPDILSVIPFGESYKIGNKYIVNINDLDKYLSLKH